MLFINPIREYLRAVAPDPLAAIIGVAKLAVSLLAFAYLAVQIASFARPEFEVHASGDHAADLDLDGLTARGNQDPRGIALRGEGLWIVDGAATVYRYPLPQANVSMSGASLSLTRTGTSSPYGVAATAAWQHSLPPSPTYRVNFAAVRCERSGTGCLTATATPVYVAATAATWTPAAALPLTPGQTVNATVRIAGCDANRLNCSADTEILRFLSIRSAYTIPDFIFVDADLIGARSPYALHAGVSWTTLTTPSPRYRSNGTIQHCPVAAGDGGDGCIDIVVPVAYTDAPSRNIAPPTLRVSEGDRVYINMNIAGCGPAHPDDCSGDITTQRVIAIRPKIPAPVNLRRSLERCRDAGLDDHSAALMLSHMSPTLRNDEKAQTALRGAAT